MAKKYNFKKDNFCVIESAISNDLATFLYNYFSMQKQVYDTCIKERYISPGCKLTDTPFIPSF